MAIADAMNTAVVTQLRLSLGSKLRNRMRMKHQTNTADASAAMTLLFRPPIQALMSTAGWKSSQTETIRKTVMSSASAMAGGASEPIASLTALENRSAAASIFGV